MMKTILCFSLTMLISGICYADGSAFTSIYYKGSHGRLKYNVRVTHDDKEYSLLAIDGIETEALIDACLIVLLGVESDVANASEVQSCVEEHLGRNFTKTLNLLAIPLNQETWKQAHLDSVQLYLYYHFPRFFKGEVEVTPQKQEAVNEFLDNRD